MENNELDLWECVIKDDGEGIDFISLVDFPAMESNFIALNSHAQIKLFAIDKQILTGVVAIPNKKIYRKDDDGYEFNVFFSESTIEKMRDKFMQGNKNANINLNHANSVSRHFINEIWIVQDPEIDKAKALGLDVPKGTLMASVKVDDSYVWENEIKTGNLKGFSLEGFFTQNLQSVGTLTQSEPTSQSELSTQNLSNQDSNNRDSNTQDLSTQVSNTHKNKNMSTLNLEQNMNFLLDKINGMFERQTKNILQLSQSKKIIAQPQRFVAMGKTIQIFSDGKIGELDEVKKQYKMFSDGTYKNATGETIVIIDGIAYNEGEEPTAMVEAEAETELADASTSEDTTKEEVKAEIITPDGIEIEVKPEEVDVIKDLKTTKEGFDIYIGEDGSVTNLKGTAIADGVYILSDDTTIEVVGGKLTTSVAPASTDMASEKSELESKIKEMETQLQALQLSSIQTNKLLEKMNTQMSNVTLAKTPNLQSPNAGITPQASPQNLMMKDMIEALSLNNTNKQTTV